MEVTEKQPWTDSDRRTWFENQKIKRSYQKEVLDRISDVSGTLEVKNYGALTVQSNEYPLVWFTSRDWAPGREVVAITGGVHGYETSGVLGALEFSFAEVEKYVEAFNFVIAPCVSPWAFETINRWNSDAIDPNRSFIENSPCEEVRKLMNAFAALKKTREFDCIAHFDLHETTDTDNTVFRPALEARDGVEIPFSEIPDGFYLVADASSPQESFQGEIVKAVEKITHIAEADSSGEIIGEPVSQKGVVHYDAKSKGLCMGFTGAKFVTTTEVYPDSPRVSPAICIAAQKSAVVAGLEYLKN